MKKRLVLSKTASAVSLLVLMTACGGGAETNANNPALEVASPQSQPQAKSATASGLKELMVQVQEAGIEKVAYFVGGTMGAYGSQMAQTGWTFKQVADLDTVPNLPQTIVYLNASDAGISAQLDDTKLSNFKGVLVIDSNMIMDAPSSEADSIAPKMSMSAGDGDSPATKIYRNLVQIDKGAAPQSTALMTSLTTRSVMALSVDKTGNVNGYSTENFDYVGAQLYALQAKRIAEGELEAPKRIADYTSNSDGINDRKDSTAIDRVVDVNQLSFGFHFVGRIEVRAWREAGPIFKDAKKYVTVLLNSGSDGTGCTIGGLPCGVYPSNSESAILVSQKLPVEFSSFNKNLDVLLPPHIYRASVQVTPVAPSASVQWTPEKSSWTAPETREIDSWETSWNKSISFSSAALSSPTLTGFVGRLVAGTVSYTRTFKKITYPWIGFEDVKNLQPQRTQYVTTGIEAINQNIMTVTGCADPIKYAESCDFALRNSINNGTYRYWVKPFQFGWKETTLADSIGPNGNRNVRSKIAYGGWNPGMMTTVEVDKNAFTSIKDTTNTVRVQAGFTAERLLAKYSWGPEAAKFGPNKNPGGYKVHGIAQSDNEIYSVAPDKYKQNHVFSGSNDIMYLSAKDFNN